MKAKEKCEWIKQNISIVDYASSIGFTVVRKGKFYSLKEHDSIMIDPYKNVYWQNSIPGYGRCIGEKGSIIDFIMRFDNMSLYEVIRQFEGEIPNDSQCHVRKEKRVFSQTMKLPEKDTNMRKVFAYLIKTRKINQKVVQFLVDNKMLYQDLNGNCVFVSYDIKNKNIPVFACRRGTNTYKPFYGDVEGCDYSQCFYVDNESNEIVVTESVIDAMSIMTMINNHKKYNYLALAGVGKWEAIKTYLDKGKIKKIIIATDNDKKNDNQGGIPCAQLICSYVKENYPDMERKWKLPPAKYGKDWNDVLKGMEELR